MPRESRFEFKRLDVFDAAVDFFAWVVEVTATVPWRYRRVSDQLVGAAVSILGNLGESGGRRLMPGEASQHYRYAQGSTHECAAYLDALLCLERIDRTVYQEREHQLARIGSMLTNLIRRQESLRHRTP